MEVIILKIEFEKHGKDILFKVSEFEPEYERVFEMCFYKKEGNSYVKSFSKSIKNIDKIMDYYFKNAEKMFNQLGYFSQIPWEKALLEFVKRLDGKNMDWWLTGSCATCIRGIDFNPHDVDIMINSKDIPQIEDLFSDRIIEPIIDSAGWVTKDFGVLFLHARIDIASDPVESLDNPQPVDCGPFANNNLEEVVWNGFKIKVPPLNLQLYTNKIRKRYERAKKIEEFLLHC